MLRVVRNATWGLGTLLLACLPPSVAWAGSETPPEGPPWVRELATAQRQALERKLPIFVYLTKTYCPHCVKLEQEVLGKKELSPIYAKAVWLYVFRDFSGDEADRAAERVALRLGFSSYPQHHLLHPATLARIGTPTRSIEGFTQAFTQARVGEIGSVEGPAALAAAEARAARLETSGDAQAAHEALRNDTDIVVRFRAVQVLAEKRPAAIVERAAELLAVPNDLLRYEVCQTLMAQGDTSSARALEAVAKQPAQSLNPNVLRIRAVQALGACGDASSVAVIAPFARGPWNNGLTRIAITSLRQIGVRDAEARAAATEALAAAFPDPAAEAQGARAARAVLALAKHVHAALLELTGKQRAFPETYDADAVAKLRGGW